MQIKYPDGRVQELDKAFFLNPEETIGDLYAVSIPFGNFSRTFVVRAREHEIVTVLLDSRFGDSIKVSAADLATATDDFLLAKCYTKEQINTLKDLDALNNIINSYEDDESLYSYFENECDYAFDSDLNVWYHSDLIMRDAVSMVSIIGEMEENL